MKYIIIILISITFSCKPIFESVYQTKKGIDFRSVEEYKTTAETKYRINTNNLYYTTRPYHFNFIDILNATKTDYYYGIFTNDSSKVFPSKYLLDNQSCLGRVIREIGQPLDSAGKDELFKKIAFVNISTNRPLEFNSNGKKKIVMIFGYTQGLLRRKEFVEIQKMVQQRNDCELFIMSVDPVYEYQVSIETPNQTISKIYK